MKNKKQRKSRQSQPKSKLGILRQVCDLIPSHLVGKLARKHGIDKKSRGFSPWSHVVSMIFAQISAAISLNDVCDNLRNHGGILATIRGALAPSRNGLSHANKVRSSAMAEELFWETLFHFERQTPSFGRRGPRKRKRGIPRRFKRLIHAVDSSTIKLVANCMSWAMRWPEKRSRRLRAFSRFSAGRVYCSVMLGFVKFDYAAGCEIFMLEALAECMKISSPPSRPSSSRSNSGGTPR